MRKWHALLLNCIKRLAFIPRMIAHYHGLEQSYICYQWIIRNICKQTWAGKTGAQLGISSHQQSSEGQNSWFSSRMQSLSATSPNFKLALFSTKPGAKQNIPMISMLQRLCPSLLYLPVILLPFGNQHCTEQRKGIRSNKPKKLRHAVKKGRNVYR